MCQAKMQSRVSSFPFSRTIFFACHCAFAERSHAHISTGPSLNSHSFWQKLHFNNFILQSIVENSRVEHRGASSVALCNH